MTINRYGLGREHTNMVGSPAIVGCADGEYVRHDDHAALISELQAELARVERIVVAQTVTIAELREKVVQQPKCATCNGTGIIKGCKLGAVFIRDTSCVDCAQPRQLSRYQTDSFRPSAHAPYATPPADGQVQQEAESWDLSHPDKTHTMTVYSREQAEHFKGVGWQDAEKVGAQITNEMVERACRVQHVGWSIWHEPQKKTAREVMRHALTSALSAQTDPAMAGDDWLVGMRDEAIKLVDTVLALTHEEEISPSKFQVATSLKAAADLMAYARKRVQPTHTLGGSKEGYTRVFNMGRDSIQPASGKDAKPARAKVSSAPPPLNTNDKAFWVMGWNDCLDSMQQERQP